MAKPDRYWTCSACGQSIENQPMIVLAHQIKHAERRPFAKDGLPVSVLDPKKYVTSDRAKIRMASPSGR